MKFAVVLALCVVAPFAARAADPVSPGGGLTEDLRYKLGVQAAQERKWDRARALFESLSKAYPQDTRAAFELARVELESGHDEAARRIANELFARDAHDHFAREIADRLKAKAVRPEVPLTFGNAASGSVWERGDEFHLAVPVSTHNGALTIGEPRLVEGPAPPMPEVAPAVRYKVRAEAPSASREVTFDPAPGPTALVERPGDDGKLSGRLIALPPGQEMPKEAWVPLLLGATRLAVVSPTGGSMSQRPLTTAELTKALLAVARPPKVAGLSAPIGMKQPGTPRLVPLARLSARLRQDYVPAGQPSGMWLRLRLVAELYVYPGLRALPDAEVPRACPYLLWPLEVPAGAPDLDGAVQKLAAYLDKPGAATRFAAAASFTPFVELAERGLSAALERYRAAQSAKPPADTSAAAHRELRALLTLVLAAGRVTRLTQEDDPASPAAQDRAAEALLFLSRFRLARK